MCHPERELTFICCQVLAQLPPISIWTGSRWSLAPAVDVCFWQGHRHTVSSVVLFLICLILKGRKARAIHLELEKLKMVVIRHRLSHQQSWTVVSKGKGSMPTEKWLSHSFSWWQLWYLAMSISRHLYMCALKILKVLLCLNRITFYFYFHLPDTLTTHSETFIYLTPIKPSLYLTIPFFCASYILVNLSCVVLIKRHWYWKTTLDLCVWAGKWVGSDCWGITQFNLYHKTTGINISGMKVHWQIELENNYLYIDIIKISIKRCRWTQGSSCLLIITNRA